MHDQFLSNTYLVGDEDGGVGVVIDAGGPVAPLLEAIDAHDLTVTHILLTHHHYDHVCELPELLARHPDAAVLIHPLEREQVEQATGALEPGQPFHAGALEIAPLHTPGHTAGMVSLLVVPRVGPATSAVFLGDTLFGFPSAACAFGPGITPT